MTKTETSGLRSVAALAFDERGAVRWQARYVGGRLQICAVANRELIFFTVNRVLRPHACL